MNKVFSRFHANRIINLNLFKIHSSLMLNLSHNNAFNKTVKCLFAEGRLGQHEKMFLLIFLSRVMLHALIAW